MNLRTRKLVGSLGIFVWLVIFCLAAMAIIGSFERPNIFVEIALYAFLGFAWILPLKPIFIWMGKGRRTE